MAVLFGSAAMIRAAVVAGCAVVVRVVEGWGCAAVMRMGVVVMGWARWRARLVFSLLFFFFFLMGLTGELSARRENP